MSRNTIIPAFAQPHQDIGSKLNHDEAIQLLQKAINRYPSFAPEVSRAIKTAEKRSIGEFYKYCDDLATRFFREAPWSWDPCHDSDYEFLMESVTKVTESINKQSPVEKFDIAIECLWTFLHPLRGYKKDLDSREYKDLGFSDTLDEVWTGLEEIIKLWAEGDEKVDQEICDLENWCGDNDMDIYFDLLAELYWSKRKTTRTTMTVMLNRKRKRTVTPDK